MLDTIQTASYKPHTQQAVSLLALALVQEIPRKAGIKIQPQPVHGVLFTFQVAYMVGEVQGVTNGTSLV